MNMAMKEVDYEQPQAEASGSVCATKHAWARVPLEPGPSERAALKDKIRRLLKEKNAVMVSHYYV
ncbi:MAG: quinolinate synthase NadA, partial [Rhodoferax sp.]|nr:quinolinate synthase NadA [Rhodoferax sp.]